jgi:hypothetical protein
MALSASKNPVIIKADATPQSQIIQINWTDYFAVAIFERHVGQAFTERDIPNDVQANKSYDVTITPGDVYTAVMYDANATEPHDPNKSLKEPPPESILTVFGFSDKRLPLIADVKLESKGGTFAVFKVSTTSPTSALVQIGETTPVTDIVGMPSFEAPVMLEPQSRSIGPAAQSASIGPAAVHTLEATPLVPGRLYVALILVSDPSGIWDYREITFNTNKRRVSGTIDSIFVQNSGDSSVGEAQFWVDVYETGSSRANKLIRQFSLGNDDYDVVNLQTITLPPPSGSPWTFTIGPKKITPEIDQLVYLNVYGIEYDGPWADERAVAPQGLLRFPTGNGKETVSSKSETVTALNQTGGDSPFQFRLSFTWSVDYI